MILWRIVLSDMHRARTNDKCEPKRINYISVELRKSITHCLFLVWKLTNQTSKRFDYPFHKWHNLILQLLNSIHTRCFICLGIHSYKNRKNLSSTVNTCAARESHKRQLFHVNEMWTWGTFHFNLNAHTLAVCICGNKIKIME